MVWGGGINFLVGIELDKYLGGCINKIGGIKSDKHCMGAKNGEKCRGA